MCEKLAWYPTLNVGCRLPTSGVTGNPVNGNTLTYSVQITFSLRFRGVRFTGDGKRGVQLYGNETVAEYGVPVYLSSGLARLPVSIKATSNGAAKDFTASVVPNGASNCRLFTFASHDDA